MFEALAIVSFILTGVFGVIWIFVKIREERFISEWEKWKEDHNI